MKTKIAKILSVLAIAGAFASCEVTTTTYYSPSWHYNCYPVYDYWGWYLYDDCYWEYYNQDGSLTQELDIAAFEGDVQALKVQKVAESYAEKFSLSMDSATKLAQNIADLEALKERTADDLADFAERVYGVNTSDLTSAISKAQVGDNAELEAVINEAALNLGTTKDQAKGIVKEIHGKALEANGINL